jgi:Secretion system C-terminal sorting domain
MKTIKFLFVFLFMSLLSAFAQTPVSTYWAYWDNDGDGHASKMRQIPAEKITIYINAGWFVVDHKPAMDCDDTNDLIFHYVKAWVDNDGDKHGVSYVQMCIGSILPPGYTYDADLLSTADCDDTNPLVWRSYCKKTPGGNITVCGGNEPSDCGVVAPAIDPLTYSVYPNPVTDRLNITPNENWNNRVEIRLVDQFGRVARVVNNPSAVKGQAISINTGDLKPGIYNLTIKNGELMATKQIGVKL